MERPMVRTKDVMDEKLVFIDGMATVQEAVNLMKAEGVRSLLVEKRNSGDAWAIISVRDIVRSVVTKNLGYEQVNVYEIMTKPVLAVPADMDIRYAARLLSRMGISRAPVEQNGELLGMITLAGIVMRVPV
ncbi:MAG: histidine kinase [Deltaproteobacteria bacterium]|nr:MAG: histidine kinase [Deltaproteobacteria bacterium]